MSFIG
jgi:hypothetical protein